MKTQDKELKIVKAQRNILIIIGLLGLIDTTTASVVSEAMEAETELGLVTLLVMYVADFVLNGNTLWVFVTSVNLFLQFGIIYLIIAYFRNKKYKSLNASLAPQEVKEESIEKPDSAIPVCSHCGSEITENSKFCGKCGNPIS